MYKTKVHAGKGPLPKQLKPVQGAAITDNRPQTVLQKMQLAAMNNNNGLPVQQTAAATGSIMQLKPVNKIKAKRKGNYYQVNSGIHTGKKLYYVRKVYGEDKFEFNDENEQSVTLRGSTDIEKITLDKGGSKKRKQDSSSDDDTAPKKVKEDKGKKYVEELNKIQDNSDKGEWVKYGGGQSTKLIRVLKNRKETGKSKIQKLHLGSETAVYPRTFKHERVAQVMRWVSTVLFNALLHEKCNPYEIQAGFYDDKLYIAGNTNASKKALEKVLGLNKDKNRSLKDSLKEVIEKEVHSSWKDGFLGERYKRHSKKLGKYILGDQVDKRYDRLENAFGKKGEIPMEEEERDGLHAERRIKKGLGENFSKTITRGLKRPCTICYVSNYSDAPKEAIGLFPERSGPFWISGASTIGYDLGKKEDLEKISKKSLHSHATVPKSQAKEKFPDVTHDFDSESDSEVESDD